MAKEPLVKLIIIACYSHSVFFVKDRNLLGGIMRVGTFTSIIISLIHIRYFFDMEGGPAL